MSALLDWWLDMYLGDYKEDYAKLNHKFTTRTTAGLPATFAGSPVVSVYKGSATDTEKTSAEAYITLSVDFDSITGLNNLLIDLSGDAFFATGEDYSIVVTTGTVNSVSVVGETIATFSIENRYERGTDSASTHTAADVWSAGSRELSTPADYKATGFSTHAAADVWSAADRALSTPADYKATGFSTLDAAGVRTAVGLASANLDTQLGAIPTTEPDIAGTAATLLGLLETHGDSTWSTADVSALATTSALTTHDGKLDTAQVDLDTIKGTDGATLATAQALYAPAKAGDLMGLANDAIGAAALSTAALAKFADTDTGETTTVAGSVAKLAQSTVLAGNGDTQVNHLTLDDEGDTMELKDPEGAGLQGVVRAYITAEYPAGGATIRAQVATDHSGAWVGYMLLSSGVQYTIEGSASGQQTTTTTVTPS